MSSGVRPGFSLHAIGEDEQRPAQEFDDDRSDLHPDEVQVVTKTHAEVADVSPEPSLLDDREVPLPEELDDCEIAEEPHHEASEQGAKKSAIAVPRQPTEEERREHEVSHLPYRTWCQDCIRGKGLTQGHRRQSMEEDEKGKKRPLIAMDYFYLGQNEEQSLPILAIVEEQTGRTFCICLPEKGVGHQYNVAATARALKVAGCLDAILKTDTERPIVALRSKLQEMFPRMACEDATKGESQSNGLIESYVGKIQAQARTMKSALDRHYPGLHARHPVLPWMVDYAAALLTRFNRGSDGATPYERATGRTWKVRLPEFAETVWFQPLKGERSRGKLEAKFEEGIFLGLQEGTAMKCIGTPSGVVRCWTIKCRPGDERWNQDLMQVLVGLPWQLKPRLEQVERGLDLPAQIEVDLPSQRGEDTEEDNAAKARAKQYQPRGIYIRRHIELEEYGYTDVCDGCDAAKMGLSHRQHSSVCKQRIREEMMKTEAGKRKVEAVDKRAEEFIVKHKEAEDRRAQQQKRKSDGEPREDAVKSTRVVEATGEEEFERILQEGNFAEPPQDASAPDVPLPAEEFAGRGTDGVEASMEVAGPGEDAGPAMEIGSLDVFSGFGSQEFQDALHELSYVETTNLLDDDVVQSQRLLLQLGQIGLHEAYGVDPAGKKPNVVEIFSPPRLTEFGKKKGLVGGVALDLTTTDSDGVPWDLSKLERQRDAEKLIEELQPELVLGCPPCGPFSVLQNLNRGKVDQQRWEEQLADAKEHLRFCCSVYKKQVSRNKFFIHEHPDRATSWDEECIQEVLQLDGVERIRGDMCRHGMVGEDEFGGGAVKKPTGFMLNSKEISKELALLCLNKPNELRVWKRIDFGATQTQSVKKGGPKHGQITRRVTVDVNDGTVIQDLHNFQQAPRSQLHLRFEKAKDVMSFFYYKEEGSKWHRHVQLLGGKAKKAEVYPELLLRHILQGLKKEMRKKTHLNSLEFGPVNEEPYFEEKALDAEDWSVFVDEVSGKALETGKVMAARAEELDYARRYDVWTLAPVSECWAMTGKPPIGSRWIDIDKGDASKPCYRSRLVIQEVRMSGTEAIFAATPPLESIRFLLSLQRSRRGYKVMFIDVRRAHWTAKIDRLVYVRLPPEALPSDCSEPMCGRLNKAMYGCRDAARQWEIEITDFFVCNGFVPGLGSPVLYVNTVRDIKVSVHGDDVTALGRAEDLEWLKDRFLERYEIKYGGMLGDGPKDVQDVMILNRLVHYGSFETTIEADPRHVQILLNELNLREAKETSTPGVRCENSDSKELNASESSRYRSLVMRGCYLSLDRPDIAYACKELARHMAHPRQCDWNGLKRLCRFLKGTPRLVWRYPEQVEQDKFTMFTDSDDAGCTASRKSTSAGALLHGAHLIKFYSSTQHIISLSSGESEFYAGIKAGSVLLGAMSMAMDLGEVRKGVLVFDATAAKAMLSRKGHGRAKHIDRSYLWLQQRVHNGDLQLEKVGTKKNGADLGTKHLERNQLEILCEEMNLTHAEGRHQLGLNV